MCSASPFTRIDTGPKQFGQWLQLEAYYIHWPWVSRGSSLCLEIENSTINRLRALHVDHRESLVSRSVTNKRHEKGGLLVSLYVSM